MRVRFKSNFVLSMKTPSPGTVIATTKFSIQQRNLMSQMLVKKMFSEYTVIEINRCSEKMSTNIIE